MLGGCELVTGGRATSNPGAFAACALRPQRGIGAPEAGDRCVERVTCGSLTFGAPLCGSKSE